jgi:hypothetical protein
MICDEMSEEGVTGDGIEGRGERDGKQGGTDLLRFLFVSTLHSYTITYCVAHCRAQHGREEDSIGYDRIG